MALAAVLLTNLTACNKDDGEEKPNAPTITLTEVGHDNSRTAHPGHDLHLEASLLAEGIINSINIAVSQSGATEKILDVSYTEGKYIGVRNTEFHEHIDIPDSIPFGVYNLFFTVTDRSGQQTVAESQLNIIEDDGDEEHEHEHSDE